MVMSPLESSSITLLVNSSIALSLLEDRMSLLATMPLSAPDLCALSRLTLFSMSWTRSSTVGSPWDLYRRLYLPFSCSALPEDILPLITLLVKSLRSLFDIVVPMSSTMPDRSLPFEMASLYSCLSSSLRSRPLISDMSLFLASSSSSLDIVDASMRLPAASSMARFLILESSSRSTPGRLRRNCSISLVFMLDQLVSPCFSASSPRASLSASLASLDRLGPLLPVSLVRSLPRSAIVLLVSRLAPVFSACLCVPCRPASSRSFIRSGFSSLALLLAAILMAGSFMYALYMPVPTLAFILATSSL